MLHACQALLAAILPIAPQDAKPVAAPVAPQANSLRFETRHRLAAAGGRLDYHAIAETTLLRDDKGEPEAEFFTFAYLAGGATARPDRPVTFAFNGGPGSSSIWLHMGLLGPKLTQVPSDAANAGAPPYPLIDNVDWLLAVTDLVMVDPIGTGLSRVVGAGMGADHWGVDEDAKSVARFIRRWLADHDRWASPKYLLGESYGGIRSALLVRELQSGSSAVALNGVMLISPALDFELVDGQDNDACYAVEIPTFAATAWYHHALPDRPDALEPFLEEVSRFVANEYVPALFKGRDLDGAERKRLVRKLHRVTGLSPEYLRRANLRVSSDRFCRELLRDRGLVVGRLDSRYTGSGARDGREPRAARLHRERLARPRDNLLRRRAQRAAQHDGPQSRDAEKLPGGSHDVRPPPDGRRPGEGPARVPRAGAAVRRA